MVSEGVDIPRLRVLVYLPNARTELAFRQAMGRVVRNDGPNDDTRAYVVMPAHRIFEDYAGRVELEKCPLVIDQNLRLPGKKECPVCGTECEISARACHECDEEFPIGEARQKPCHECGSPNPLGVQSCVACGASFTQDFTVQLNDALRHGAIVRGMEVDEEEVALGEQMAPELERKYFAAETSFLSIY